jgi:hypothetical protein
VAEHADRVTVDGLRWGVEPICRVLSEHGTPIAPSTFYDARDRRSDRAGRDEELKGRGQSGLDGELRRLRRPEGIAGPQPGGHAGGPLHGGTADA